MSKIKFTPEQQAQLRNNPYTAAVTTNTLSFTKEFKSIFHNEYLHGAVPKDILRKYGYPADLLGHERIKGITYYINKQFNEYGEFYDIHNKAPSRSGYSPEDELRQLKHQVNYLTQEIEFLKKISSIRNIRK